MEILEQALAQIRPLDRAAMTRAQVRLDSLTKPPGSLGVLEELGVKLAGITGRVPPVINDKVIIIMAGDHGVAAEGVSAFPQEVTSQMVRNFLQGGAAINVLSRHVGARITCVDIGVAMDVDHAGLVVEKVGYGTRNIANGPAMSRVEAVRCVETGIKVAWQETARGADIIGTGDMGIANTTPSTAILSAFSGFHPSQIVGRGTGIDDAGLHRKISVIEQAIAINRPDPRDAIDVLAKVGGMEIGGIAGVILGAAARRVPVVIDGFISGAGALVASRLAPAAVDYMIASHNSIEPGHKLMMHLLNARPMLEMKMRLGEGTGAALAISLVEAAVKIMREMATFAEAAVSGKV